MSETITDNENISENQNQKDRLDLTKQSTVIVIDGDKVNKEDDEATKCNTEPRTGLINSGNDCFINSAIQCLAVSPFIHAFIKRYQEDDNKMVFIINKYELGKLKADQMQEYIEKLLSDNYWRRKAYFTTNCKKKRRYLHIYLL